MGQEEEQAMKGLHVPSSPPGSAGRLFHIPAAGTLNCCVQLLLRPLHLSFSVSGPGRPHLALLPQDKGFPWGGGPGLGQAGQCKG